MPRPGGKGSHDSCMEQNTVCLAVAGGERPWPEHAEQPYVVKNVPSARYCVNPSLLEDVLRSLPRVDVHGAPEEQGGGIRAGDLSPFGNSASPP